MIVLSFRWHLHPLQPVHRGPAEVIPLTTNQDRTGTVQHATDVFHTVFLHFNALSPEYFDRLNYHLEAIDDLFNSAPPESA